MKNLISALFAAVLSCATVYGQQPAQRTAWHRSVVVTYTHASPSGHASGIGETVASVPTGFTGVIEQVSARCVAPRTLSLVYGDVVLGANPSNPGQSGKPGPPGQEDSANHPLVFQTAYPGPSTVYVASQQVKLRVTAPKNWVVFNGFFVSDAPDSLSAALSATCLVSISGYIERY